MKKILVIEDEPEMRRNITTLLRYHDYESISAENGRAGVETARREKPDLILLDMMMPGMDGPTTYSQLKKQGSSVPVIFMTAKVQTHEVEDHLKLGAAGVIAKPFDPMTLHKDIMRIVDPLASGNAPG